MSKQQLAQRALDEGNGVFRLAPAWVPRSFCRPGRRIKLHPEDYYVLGLERGMALIEEIEGAEALFITSDGGKHRTKNFG